MDLNEQCQSEFRITTWPRWDYDLEIGTLTFSDGGVPKVVASILVVGTTSHTSNTWLWAWDNASLPECVKGRMREVRAFGVKEGIQRLTEGAMPDDEYLGWEMTAIAARLLGAKGAYRCPDESGFMYVIYTSVHFAGNDNAATDDPASHATIACDVHGTGMKTFVCEHLVVNPQTGVVFGVGGSRQSMAGCVVCCVRCPLSATRRVERRQLAGPED